MRQTGGSGRLLTQDNWRSILHGRLQALDWGQVAADVRPFLAPGTDPDRLPVENALRVLRPG